MFRNKSTNIILSSSSIHIQQIAILNEKFVRLKKKFAQYKSINFEESNFIVFEKLKLITKKNVIVKQSYI